MTNVVKSKGGRGSAKNETHLTHDANTTLENATTFNNITVCGLNVTETFGQNQTLCNESSTEVGNSTDVASGTRGENTTEMTGQKVTDSTETPLSSTTSEDEGGDGKGNEPDTSTETIKTTSSETIPTTWTTTIETTPDPIAEACSNDVDK